MRTATPASGLPEGLPRLNRILVVKMSSLGDVVHSLPAASALRRRYPELRMTWAAESWVSPLVRSHPAVDRVVSFPTMRGSHFSPDWIRRFVAAGRELRHERYDLALDLQGLFKSSVAAVLSRAPVRIGLGGRQREGARFVSRGIPFPAQRAHPVLENLACAEFLGASGDLVRFEVAAEPAARLTVGRLLAKAGIGSDEAILVVNPSDAFGRKTWPVDRWVRVAEGLAHQGRVLLVGSTAQQEIHAELARRCSGVCDLTGKTSLPELVAVLERSALHVAPDTGTLHLAVALGRPVVGLYGPTSPDWIGPFGQRSHVLDGNERCGGTCPHTCLLRRRCLRKLAPEELVSLAAKVLSENDRPQSDGTLGS